MLSTLPINCILISLQDMGNLAKTSLISVIFDCMLIAIVVYFSPAAENIEKFGMNQIISNSKFHITSFFRGLGVLCFAFVCQHSAFIIASSLERPTKKRWDVVTGISITICTILAIIMGVSGFIAFLDDTEGDILVNLGKYAEGVNLPNAFTHQAANIGRGLLCITMFFVYPMELFVARHVCVVLLFKGRRAHEGDDHTILARRDRRVAVTTALYLLSLLPALISHNVGKAFALSGALGGATLSYMCPGILYIAVHGEEFLDIVESRWGYDYIKSYMKHTHVFRRSTKSIKKSTETNGDPSKILWQILLMPLWCRIASYGKKMVDKHEKEEAKKSPHPYVFGKIIHHRHTDNGRENKVTKHDQNLERSYQQGGRPPLHQNHDDENSNFFRTNSLPNILKPMNAFGSSIASSTGSKGRSKKVGFQARDSLGHELHVNEKEELLANYRPISADSFHAASFEVIRSGYGSSGIFEEDEVDDVNSIEKEDHLFVIDDLPQDIEKNDDIDVEKNESMDISFHSDDTDHDSVSSSVFVEDENDTAIYESDCDSKASSVNVSPSPLRQVNYYKVATHTTYSKFDNMKSNADMLKKLNQKDETISVVTETTGTTQPDFCEVDPQDELPTVVDFCIAVYYVIFGFVAAFAGVFSAMNN